MDSNTCIGLMKSIIESFIWFISMHIYILKKDGVTTMRSSHDRPHARNCTNHKTDCAFAVSALTSLSALRS